MYIEFRGKTIYSGRRISGRFIMDSVTSASVRFLHIKAESSSDSFGSPSKKFSSFMSCASCSWNWAAMWLLIMLFVPSPVTSRPLPMDIVSISVGRALLLRFLKNSFVGEFPCFRYFAFDCAIASILDLSVMCLTLAFRSWYSVIREGLSESYFPSRFSRSKIPIPILRLGK